MPGLSYRHALCMLLFWCGAHVRGETGFVRTTPSGIDNATNVTNPVDATNGTTTRGETPVISADQTIIYVLGAVLLVALVAATAYYVRRRRRIPRSPSSSVSNPVDSFNSEIPKDPEGFLEENPHANIYDAAELDNEFILTPFRGPTMDPTKFKHNNIPPKRPKTKKRDSAKSASWSAKTGNRSRFQNEMIKIKDPFTIPEIAAVRGQGRNGVEAHDGLTRRGSWDMGAAARKREKKRGSASYIWDLKASSHEPSNKEARTASGSLKGMLQNFLARRNSASKSGGASKNSSPVDGPHASLPRVKSLGPHYEDRKRNSLLTPARQFLPGRVGSVTPDPGPQTEPPNYNKDRITESPQVTSSSSPKRSPAISARVYTLTPANPATITPGKEMYDDSPDHSFPPMKTLTLGSNLVDTRRSQSIRRASRGTL